MQERINSGFDAGTVGEEIDARPSFRARVRVAAIIVVLITAICLSLTIWLMAGRRTMPSLSLDEWVVTDNIISRGLIPAVLIGHNRHPTYIQNLIFKLDLDHFNYKKQLPHWFQNAALTAGILLLLYAVYQTGIGLSRVGWTASLFLILWFSPPNSAHFGSWYLWRGIESSGVLLFLSISLVAALQVVSANGRFNTSIVCCYLITSAAAWIALYFHGGFTVLPIILLLLALTTGDRRLRAMGAIIVVFFAFHFLHVHPFHSAHSQAGFYPKSMFTGIVLVLTNLLFIPVYELTGSRSIATLAGGAISVSGIALALWLLYQLFTSPEKKALRLIAVALLGYTLMIAASIAYARLLHEPDWKYAMCWRYRNYSVYFFVGLLLAAWSLPDSLSAYRTAKLVRYGNVLILACSAFLIGFTSMSTMKNLWWMPSFYHATTVPFTLEDGVLPHRSVITEKRRRHANNYRDLLRKKGGNVFSAKAYRAYRDYLSMPSSVAEAVDVTQCWVNWDPVTREKLPHGDLIEIKGWLGHPWIKRPASLLFFDSAGRIRGWGLRCPADAKPWQARFWKADTGNYLWGYARVPVDIHQLQAVLVDESGRWLCKSTPINFVH